MIFNFFKKHWKICTIIFLTVILIFMTAVCVSTFRKKNINKKRLELIEEKEDVKKKLEKRKNKNEEIIDIIDSLLDKHKSESRGK